MRYKDLSAIALLVLSTIEIVLLVLLTTTIIQSCNSDEHNNTKMPVTEQNRSHEQQRLAKCKEECENTYGFKAKAFGLKDRCGLSADTTSPSFSAREYARKRWWECKENFETGMDKAYNHCMNMCEIMQK